MGRAPRNISANSGRNAGQIKASERRPLIYSAAMHRSPALPCPDHVLRLRVGAVLMALVAQGAFVAPAHAQAAVAGEAITATGTASLDNGLEQKVLELALAGTRAGVKTDANADAQAGAPRFEVSVGQLDARLRLAPCQHVDPYLPEGTRLWGKARIGLRCTQGPSRWNVYLPITVKAFGPALTATGPLAAGSVLTPGDLARAEVDLAEDASAAMLHADLAVGRVLTRPLKAGQSLRQSHLKPRQWFAAGDTVTVVAQGPGFSVAGEAQALTNGIEGQPARVRTEGGRMLTGQPVGDRRVELGL